MQSVSFVCLQENRRIGHIEIADGQQVLISPRELARSFKHDREEFRIVAMQRSGQVFTCPRCNGRVGIDGQTVDDPPVVLGETVIQALPVDVQRTGS